MTPQKWTSVILATLILFMSQASLSQTNTAKRNVAAVFFASLGGAVLGLSTLSFYSEPQEHTNNITMGTLIGFLGGVGYVVYDSSRPAPASFEYSQGLEQEIKNQRALAVVAKAPLLIQFKVDF